MKIFFLICAAVLIIGVFNLPIGYYTFLRIIVFIDAIIICLNEWGNKSKLWLIVFGLVAILFNPFIPVYLNNKGLWIPIDIISAILFVAKSLTNSSKSEKSIVNN